MLGELGLELARERSPDVILLDLHLPDLGGEEVLTRLRAEPATREIPVVVLSADATGRQREPLLAAGALDYLTKPIEVRALLEVIDRVLAPAPMAARSDRG
jgi:CheY-like chemotaxis protein